MRAMGVFLLSLVVSCGGRPVAFPEDPAQTTAASTGRLLMERVDGFGGPTNWLIAFRNQHCGGGGLSFIRLYDDGWLYYGEPGTVWQRRLPDHEVQYLMRAFDFDRLSDHQRSYDLGQNKKSRVGGPAHATFTAYRGDRSVSVRVVDSSLEYSEWTWLIPTDLVQAVERLDLLARAGTPYLSPAVHLAAMPTSVEGQRREAWPIPVALSALVPATYDDTFIVTDPPQVKRLHAIFSGPNKRYSEVFAEGGRRFLVTACGALP